MVSGEEISLDIMQEAKQIRPELVEQVEALKATDQDATVTLRGLHRLYFDTKPTATWDEKAYLIGEGAGFSAKNVPYAEDRVIFDEEAARFRAQQQTE